MGQKRLVNYYSFRDARLISVSSSLGDDETAEFYAPRDIGDIQDPGLIKPFKPMRQQMLLQETVIQIGFF